MVFFDAVLYYIIVTKQVFKHINIVSRLLQFAVGGHVGEYMEYLDEEDNAKYQEHFASYIANDMEADGLEELYESVHEKIREDPSPSDKKEFAPDKSFKRKSKLTWDERKARVEAKKEAKKAELAEDDDE